MFVDDNYQWNNNRSILKPGHYITFEENTCNYLSHLRHNIYVTELYYLLVFKKISLIKWISL